MYELYCRPFYGTVIISACFTATWHLALETVNDSRASQSKSWGHYLLFRGLIVHSVRDAALR